MLKNRSATQSMAEFCYAYISPQIQLSKYNPWFNCFWFRTIVRYRSGNKSIDLPHSLKAILFACLHDRASATWERPAWPSQTLKAKACMKLRFYDLLSHWLPAQRSVPLFSEGLANQMVKSRLFLAPFLSLTKKPLLMLLQDTGWLWE